MHSCCSIVTWVGVKHWEWLTATSQLSWQNWQGCLSKCQPGDLKNLSDSSQFCGSEHDQNITCTSPHPHLKTATFFAHVHLHCCLLNRCCSKPNLLIRETNTEYISFLRGISGFKYSNSTTLYFQHFWVVLWSLHLFAFTFKHNLKFCSKICLAT